MGIEPTCNCLEGSDLPSRVLPAIRDHDETIARSVTQSQPLVRTKCDSHYMEKAIPARSPRISRISNSASNVIAYHTPQSEHSLSAASRNCCVATATACGLLFQPIARPVSSADCSSQTIL